MSGLMFDLKDEKEAEEYLKTVNIEYGFQCKFEKRPDGCHRLADFLEAVRKDYPEAGKEFKANCEDNNYSRSCFKFGQYLLIGRGIEKDVPEAMKFFEKGCELKHSGSCHNAALLLTSGDLGIKDPERAERYMKRSCDELKDNESCYFLSTFYLAGTGGIQKDMSKAFHYSKIACDQNNVQACCNLSQMYKRGDGVEKNVEAAKAYQKKAKRLYKGLPVDS